MNCRYFACPNCRLYIDAGYRWAYWQIEHTEHVRLGEGVDIASLLSCNGYFHPPQGEKSSWLCDEVLPAVREFLVQHQDHGIVYIEEGHIYAEDSLYFNWKEIETGQP